jgi:endonuclease G
MKRGKKKIQNLIVSLISSALLLTYATACGGGENDPIDSGSALTAIWQDGSIVESDKENATISLSGDLGSTWTAEITEGSNWCSFSKSTATSSKTGTIKGNKTDVIYVYFSANTGSAQRSATIVITGEGEDAVTLSITQLIKGEESDVPFGRWAELPTEVANSNYTYLTHYVALNNSNVRNYSICFDKTKKAALWVAYPMHSCYLGSAGRSNEFIVDPELEPEWQADLTKSYKGSYDRGHQIASADRQATTEMNVQTFYFSNMTPQLDRLNQDMWAQLESKVRENKCNDTLYVVTGAYFGSGAATTTDGAGNTVPVPTHYFKVLLRTKAGNSGKAVQECSASELISIGFWVEHKSYGNIAPPTSICTTVKDIEQKTGFTFFPSVDASVKQQNNPAQWNIN